MLHVDTVAVSLLLGIMAFGFLWWVVRGATSGVPGRRQAFVEKVIELFPVLPFDTSVARIYARIWASLARKGQIVGAHDLIIAATARATRRTVITADPGAFADLPGVSWRSHR